MESFEHLCKIALEAEGFAVTGNVKFPVRRRTRRTSHEEYQTHGYEVDLVGARGNQLVLAEAKSYFGSIGVNRQGFVGLANQAKRTYFDRYKLINDPELRNAVLSMACERFGYSPEQIRWRVYVGKFAKGQDGEIRRHLRSLEPPFEVMDLSDIATKLIELAKQKTYIDDPVLMTVKAMIAAGRLTGEQPSVADFDIDEEDSIP